MLHGAHCSVCPALARKSNLARSCKRASVTQCCGRKAILGYLGYEMSPEARSTMAAAHERFEQGVGRGGGRAGRKFRPKKGRFGLGAGKAIEVGYRRVFACADRL